MFRFRLGSGVALGAFLGVATLSGCDLTGPLDPSGSGSLFIDLQSPNGPEGAAVFEIRGGGGLGEISASVGWPFSWATEDGMRVVIILPEPGPVQFQLLADDVGRIPEVSVLEVAGPDNTLRESLAEYRVEVFPFMERRER